MTAVRRHLVGVLALVLAVAAGVALGAGPLSHQALLPSAASPAPTDAPSGRTAPSADDLAEVVAPALYGTRLQGRSVAVVAAPGVPAATLDEISAGITAADGAVAARWLLGETLVGAQDKALVDTLGSQLTRQLEGRFVSTGAATYERMGQLLGGAVASRRTEGATPSQDAQTVRQSLAAAKLVTAKGSGNARLAPLVLLVLHGDVNDDVLGGLLSGLASRASGVVVAGPAGDSDLPTLAGLDSITTVEGVDGAAGRLGSVLALSRVENNPGGSYGASGSDGLLPLG